MDFFDIFLNWDIMIQAGPLLLQGLLQTVLLGFTGIIVGSILGLIIVLVRLYGAWPLKLIAIAYIDLFRAFPLLVFLTLVYYALPYIGITLLPFWASVVALSIIGAAYIAEVFRAGIEAVAEGQFEAAHALGFSWIRMMTDVILPQAFKIVIPPATGVGVNLIKDTALASVVSMPELLKQATSAQSFYANPSPLVAAALLYLVVLLPLVRLVSALEARQTRVRH